MRDGRCLESIGPRILALLVVIDLVCGIEAWKEGQMFRAPNSVGIQTLPTYADIIAFARTEKKSETCQLHSWVQKGFSSFKNIRTGKEELTYFGE